jgi:hypothetical protein
MQAVDIVWVVLDAGALILVHLLLYGAFGLAIAKRLLSGSPLHRTNAGIRALGRAIAQKLPAVISSRERAGVCAPVKECCKNEANLTAAEPSEVPNETVRRCKVCGRPQRVLALQSGVYAISGAAANLTVKRGEKSMAALYVMFGVATAAFTFTIQVAEAIVGYKVIVTIVDYAFLVYLFFFDSWFRSMLLGVFDRVQTD